MNLKALNNILSRRIRIAKKPILQTNLMNTKMTYGRHGTHLSLS